MVVGRTYRGFYSYGGFSPLSLLPAAPQQPPLHLHNQLGQVLWVGLDDLVKLGKLSGSEKYFGQAKLEILVIQTESLEQGFAK